MKIYVSKAAPYGYTLLPSVYVRYKIGGKWWQTYGIDLEWLRYRIYFTFYEQ